MRNKEWEKDILERADNAVNDRAGIRRCDFCDVVNPEPNKAYACQSFHTIAFVDEETRFDLMGSQGAWLACVPCAQFIDAGDVTALVDRCFAVHSRITDNPAERTLLRSFLTLQYEQFMLLKARTQ